MTGIPLGQATRRTRLLTYGYAVLLALLPTLAALVALSAIFQLLPERWESLAAGAAAAPVFVAGAVLLTRRAGRRGARHAVYVLTSVYALVVLPLLGLLLDGVANGCVRTCGRAFRPLAMPEVVGLVPLQAAAALAFFLSVRRPESLASRIEAALVAGLGVGLVLHAAMAVQLHHRRSGEPLAGTPAPLRPAAGTAHRRQPAARGGQRLRGPAPRALAAVGRLARRTNDALALPISGWLCRRWAADALYLSMKPAEALFVLALLFLDPGDPEARVERMHR